MASPKGKGGTPSSSRRKTPAKTTLGDSVVKGTGKTWKDTMENISKQRTSRKKAKYAHKENMSEQQHITKRNMQTQAGKTARAAAYANAASGSARAMAENRDQKITVVQEMADGGIGPSASNTNNNGSNGQQLDDNLPYYMRRSP